MQASCTWGDGPDILLTLANTRVILWEAPKNDNMPQRVQYTYGYVTQGDADLTADEAEKLGHELIHAAKAARDLDKEYTKHMNSTHRIVGEEGDQS